MQLGVISDTHGLLRPQAVAALRGSEHIIHAGDIGSPEILNALREIAPVTAVRGNNDWEQWALDLPVAVTGRLASVGFHVVHDIAELSADLRSSGVRIIVTGHSHRPKAETHDGVLYLNPGSAGPRRFKLPVTVARIFVVDSAVSAELISLT